jgi:glyoxylase-like metal-dependent hydrolase (beta-lactamase superfamily II)
MSELKYPFADPPQPGQLLEIIPGIKWLRMPLPMQLNHINLYLLEDDDGWWVVDTGIGLDPTQELWERVFEEELEGKPVKAVLCTHMHPDHVGQAGWLCDRWRAPLYMTQSEYLSARAYSKFTVDDLSWTSEQHYHQAGMGENYFEKMKQEFHGFASVCVPLPGAYQRLENSDYLTIGGVRWRIFVGSGHSPEHACLYSAAHNILISGDQVIPRITSNVSVSPSEPLGNPLRSWLKSHEDFLESLPADALVLPAHNTPFYGLHHRLRSLIQHHEDHLLALEEACLQAQTARSLLPVLFKRELDGSQVGLALGECIAHLNYLVWRGQLQRSLDEQGVYLYHSSDETLKQRLRQARHDRDEAPMQV